MRITFLIGVILATLIVVNGSITKVQNDSGESGDALFLTEYIENGDIETARKLALVDHPEMPIESYAGYLTVDKEYNSNLFFHFVPAKENPQNAPVLLYLHGRGTSSVLFALIDGPYHVNSSGQLEPNEYSWHLNHSVLFIDNPVGVGFSFTESDDGYARNQVDVGRNLLNALHQFFFMFPKLQKNDFFVYGISYGGKYAPAIGYAIHQDNKREESDPSKPKINLKGVIIGDGWTDPIHQMSFGEYYYQLGLFDSNGKQKINEFQNQATDCIEKGDFIGAHEYWDKLVELMTNLTGIISSNLIHQSRHVTAEIAYINKTITRRAFHMGDTSFELGNKTQLFFYPELMTSVADWVAELLSHYRVWFFNGQIDPGQSYPFLMEILSNLQFSGAEEYKTANRHIWRVDNEIAGYAKQAGNLTEVLVRNAGHIVSMEQPKWVLDLLLRFTQQKQFD